MEVEGKGYRGQPKIWIIKGDSLCERILLKYRYQDKNYWPTVRMIYAFSLRLFYDNSLRNSLKITNLSWDGQWNCLWDDPSDIFYDGNDTWKWLIKHIDGNYLPAKEMEKYFPDGLDINMFVKRIDCPSKEEQATVYKYRWNSFVDNWLCCIRRDKDFESYFDKHLKIDEIDIYVMNLQP